MRFVVMYGQGNADGVMVFTVEDMEAARRFVSDLITLYGHTKVSEPQPYSGNIGDLHKLFPPKRKTVEEL